MRVGPAGDWVARKPRESEGGVVGSVAALSGLPGRMGRWWKG